MRTILIIENDEKAALALVIRLKACGYSTRIAADAIQGLSMALRHRPELILLDIALPGGDGFSLAEKLRTLPQTKHLPVIFLTGSKDPELRKKALDLGVAGLLEKPYQTDELLLMVSYVFERPATARYRVPSARAATAEKKEVNFNKILLVEDDRRIALGLEIRLKAAGYDALLAHDGLDAINVAVKDHPDLILLDISMPAGNGFTVARRIQTAIPTPTPIIFLTASKQPEFRQKAAELGAAGFFEKPFEADQLLATIKNTLAARTLGLLAAASSAGRRFLQS
jgi:DNA-binding response OmpR family regulator